MLEKNGFRSPAHRIARPVWWRGAFDLGVRGIVRTLADARLDTPIIPPLPTWEDASVRDFAIESDSGRSALASIAAVPQVTIVSRLRTFPENVCSGQTIGNASVAVFWWTGKGYLTAVIVLAVFSAFGLAVPAVSPFLKESPDIGDRLPL